MSTIREAREAAEKVLKPSTRDMQYGLELHRKIAVVDAYGFGPHSPVRPDRLGALIEAGASQLEVQQAREHDGMTRWAWDDAIRSEAAEAWEASGVNCLFVNAGEEGNEIHTMLKRLGNRTYAAEVGRELAHTAYTPEDLQQTVEEDAHCYYRVTNGVPLSNRRESVEDELSYVRPFFHLGARMMHLTYNRANMIGGGCGEATDRGLTDFGRAAVAELNRIGVIVDVAHSGLQTSLDAAQISEQPMVASHSMCYALHEHIRSKTDEVIRAIADTDGFVGVVMISRFLDRTFDLNALLDHLEYMAKLVGARHVAIGSDKAHSCPAPEGESGSVRLPKTRAHWRALWPEGSLGPVPTGTPPEADLSLAWTNFPMITVGLVQRGFSDEDIRAIMGGNAMRVAKVLWDQRDL